MANILILWLFSRHVRICLSRNYSWRHIDSFYGWRISGYRSWEIIGEGGAVLWGGWGGSGGQLDT